MRRIAGEGVGNTRWKVPVTLNWPTGIYNPVVDVTKDTTMLHTSDRKVFRFLVDSVNPIKSGKLPVGMPDLHFRGFFIWSSEVGAKTLGIARSLCEFYATVKGRAERSRLQAIGSATTRKIWHSQAV